MFLVLVVHSDFVSLGYPTLEQLFANPLGGREELH